MGDSGQPWRDLDPGARQPAHGAAHAQPGRARPAAAVSHWRAPAVFNPNSSDADISQQIRNWLQSEPTWTWFPQYTTRFSRAYKFAAEEAHKAGFSGVQPHGSRAGRRA